MAGEIEQQADRGIKPWMRAQVWHELAGGDMTQADVARKYGISRQAVHQFARRWAREIDEARGRIADQFSGLWAADKRNRIAALQHEYELAFAHRNAGHFEWIGKRLAILHQIAEELGQIPQRSQVQVTGVVTHRLIGVDLEAAFPPMLTGDIDAAIEAELRED